jgi:hypothetical protein
MFDFASEAGSQIDSKTKPTLQRLKLSLSRKAMRASYSLFASEDYYARMDECYYNF